MKPRQPGPDNVRNAGTSCDQFVTLAPRGVRAAIVPAPRPARAAPGSRVLPAALSAPMPRFVALGALLSLAVSAAEHSPASSAPASAPAAPGWTRHADFPLPPGMAGILAGTHAGAVLAAGGANFPDKMPWDGGKKHYYDEIFVLPAGARAWQAAGRLPEKRGYAAMVSLPAGVLAIGGESADAPTAEVWWLRVLDGKVTVTPAPSLPEPRTCAAAVVSGGKIYVAGGYAPGPLRASTADFLVFDPARAAEGWRRLPTWPGPTRGQAVMAALDDAVYLISGLEMQAGADGKPAPRYLADAYRFRQGAWEKLPDPPWSAIAAPSPAPVTASPAGGLIHVLGGVDSRRVGKVPRDTRVPDHRLDFDVARHTWIERTDRWPASVVTAPAFQLGSAWWIVSGEIMAGVRTPQVWSWSPATQSPLP